MAQGEAGGKGGGGIPLAESREFHLDIFKQIPLIFKMRVFNG